MTIPLRDLRPHWLRFERDQEGIHHIVCRRERAQGIALSCPKCDGGPGAHRIVCWSRTAGVPDDAHPGPGRWQLIGETYDTLTLKGETSSDSVQLRRGCGWHGFIENGQVRDAPGT